MAGFFVVEDTVLSTTQGRVTKQWIDELWELAIVRVADVVRAQVVRGRRAIGWWFSFSLFLL